MVRVAACRINMQSQIVAEINLCWWRRDYFLRWRFFADDRVCSADRSVEYTAALEAPINSGSRSDGAGRRSGAAVAVRNLIRIVFGASLSD